MLLVASLRALLFYLLWLRLDGQTFIKLDFVPRDFVTTDLLPTVRKVYCD